jgi:hypothetical protein
LSAFELHKGASVAASFTHCGQPWYVKLSSVSLCDYTLMSPCGSCFFQLTSVVGEAAMSFVRYLLSQVCGTSRDVVLLGQGVV